MGKIVSTRIERAWLRAAYNAAVSASISIAAQLESVQSTVQATIATGQIVAATSRGNALGSASVSFTVPVAGFTPVTLVEFLEELLIANEDTAEDLGYDVYTVVTAERTAIFESLMADRKHAPREAYADFTNLRTGFEEVQS